MTTTLRPLTTHLALLLASAALLTTACPGRSEAIPPEIAAKLPPARGPLGNSYLGSDGVAKDGRNDAAAVEDSCVEDGAGGWDCSYSDGETICTYGYDAAGVLTY